ncbi:MAG: hypothetical protein H6631_15990 [Anaerolineaceae bacterium]|nr:hypothetical protein [Anaerolineaceae bacterium]
MKRGLSGVTTQSGRWTLALGKPHLVKEQRQPCYDSKYIRPLRRMHLLFLFLAYLAARNMFLPQNGYSPLATGLFLTPNNTSPLAGLAFYNKMAIPRWPDLLFCHKIVIPRWRHVLF